MVTKLVIRKDSWHYQYFLRIRRLWGIAGEPDRISLCPYCQTMFWMSLGTLVASPMMLLGWLLLKAYRNLYKLAERMGWSRFVDWLDSSQVGKTLDEASTDDIETNPAGTTFIIALMTLLMSIVAIAAIGMLLWALVIVVCSIPHWPSALWIALQYIGWALFNVFAMIGAASYWTGYGIYHGLSWLFTASVFWSKVLFFLLVALKWIGIVIAVGAAAFLLLVTLSKLAKTRLMVWLWDKIIFKLNGYQKARESAAVRREQARVVQPKTVPKPKKPRVFWPAVYNRVLTPIGHFFKMMWCSDKKVTGARAERKVRVLHLFGMVGSFLWAIKKRACPLVVFADDTVLQWVGKTAEAEASLKRDDRSNIMRAIAWFEYGACDSKADLRPHLDAENVPAVIKVVIAAYILDEMTRDEAYNALYKYSDMAYKKA